MSASSAAILQILLLVAAFFVIRQVPPVVLATESLRHRLKDGLRFVRSRTDLAELLLMVFLAAFFAAPIVSMLPALVEVVFQGKAENFSFLISAFGIGALIAAVLIAAIDRNRISTKWPFAALAALGLTQATIAFSDEIFLTTAMIVLAGLFFVGAMIRLGTTILQTTPDPFRGRVSSFQQLSFRSGQPLGALVAGFIARQYGIRVAFCAFGGLLATCMVTMVLRKIGRTPTGRDLLI